MSCLEDLSGEILMTIFEYMNIEDIWTVFFHMNTRFNNLVFDSRLRLVADTSNIEEYNFDRFCSSLTKTNFNNIYVLILSNNYYRYPQIRQFLSYTNLSNFQCLYSLSLIDINYNESIEIMQQIKQLNQLKHLHINTHEIYDDKQLANVTQAVFDQPNIRALALDLHEKIQWLDTEMILLNNVEVLSLNFININHLFSLLSHCPNIRSLSMMLDSRNSLTTPTNNIPSLSESQLLMEFPQITNLRFYFRIFNDLVLAQLLTSLPSIKRFSIDTIINNKDHIRAPFWTSLLQERLPLLERIRLVVRTWNMEKSSNYIDENQQNPIGGYKYDRYWLDKAHKKIFTCSTNSDSMVLQIR
ncbi:unnamed protein product [Adineta steineri]|uniref:F-box domain-containing protein n=2 Tax=Adineta steineri TaxID=433720 RepID=A0A819PPQ3_9BILA|nr:unnamed protein product [Adineta steineri]CAF4017597.1 unnamed protein product [Adineta steineri]